MKFYSVPNFRQQPILDKYAYSFLQSKAQQQPHNTKSHKRIEFYSLELGHEIY